VDRLRWQAHVDAEVDASVLAHLGDQDFYEDLQGSHVQLSDRGINEIKVGLARSNQQTVRPSIWNDRDLSYESSTSASDTEHCLGHRDASRRNAWCNPVLSQLTA
jgi:hypothetical protein